MKKYRILKYCCLLLVIVSCKNSSAQHAENWTSKELTEPSALAATLRANKNVPVMFSVGPEAIIPNSIDIGMTNNETNLAKFKKQISRLSRSANILIYCGCCPFEHCPNVRPAIALLHSMQFTNYHLLNLSHNIKKDWISKGYPVTK